MADRHTFATLLPGRTALGGHFRKEPKSTASSRGKSHAASGSAGVRPSESIRPAVAKSCGRGYPTWRSQLSRSCPSRRARAPGRCSGVWRIAAEVGLGGVRFTRAQRSVVYERAAFRKLQLCLMNRVCGSGFGHDCRRMERLTCVPRRRERGAPDGCWRSQDMGRPSWIQTHTRTTRYCNEFAVSFAKCLACA